MAECYSINQYEQAAHLLPIRFQRIALHLPDWQKEQAEELRLRAGHPMTVLLPRGEQSLGPEALVTQGDLEQLCDTVTGYSRYTAAETMSRGYITAKGGFRIGLCGTVVLQEGRSINLRSLSSACIRIAREIPGLADGLVDRLFQNDRYCSTLIIAPPGLGKTTLLRDLVRCLSDGTDALPAHRVSLVDERGEVAVMLEGQPQMEVGCHTDVMDSCPKSVAIPMLLRSANPQIIAVDEITQARDLAAMEEAAYCGVRFWPPSMLPPPMTCIGAPCCKSCKKCTCLKRRSPYIWRIHSAAIQSATYDGKISGCAADLRRRSLEPWAEMAAG